MSTDINIGIERLKFLVGEFKIAVQQLYELGMPKLEFQEKMKYIKEWESILYE